MTMAVSRGKSPAGESSLSGLDDSIHSHLHSLSITDNDDDDQTAYPRLTSSSQTRATGPCKSTLYTLHTTAILSGTNACSCCHITFVATEQRRTPEQDLFTNNSCIVNKQPITTLRRFEVLTCGECGHVDEEFKNVANTPTRSQRF